MAPGVFYLSIGFVPGSGINIKHLFTLYKFFPLARSLLILCAEAKGKLCIKN